MDKITYPVFMELAPDGRWSAFVPDLPVCAVVGFETVPEALESLAIGVEMHLESILEDGHEIPEPTRVEYVTVQRVSNQAADRRGSD
jgi:predicted RNase H-like HicB family nuclease